MAVKSMISHADKISGINLDASGSEYFFKYDNKSVWGIRKSSEDYYLYLYPKNKDTDELLSVTVWENVTIQPDKNTINSNLDKKLRPTYY
ncbi:hypothetical protein [Methanolobus sp. ZRKC5]|uniref:hypothetical protein n=1 Tax=unclassified Methanolobus TaxID=2629569 RepID=UPI00313DDECD